MARIANPGSTTQAIVSGQMAALLVLTGCMMVFVACISTLALQFHLGGNPPVPVFAAPRVDTPSQLNPEPVERMVFILLAALTPIALVIAAKFVRSFQFTPRHSAQLIILASALFVLPFIASDLTVIMFFPPSVGGINKATMALAAALLVGLTLASCWLSPVKRPGSLGLSVSIAFLATVFLQVLPYRLASANTVTVANTWSVSYDAATYALSQVVAGKTLLVDLPSQYGLFPELIAPLFKAIGLSVSTISSFFILLQLTGLLSIAVILHLYVHTPLLRLMTFLCTLISTGLFLYLNGYTEEIYLQYYPIRFICPALALLLFSLYCKRPTRLREVLMGIAAGVSIIWNLDSGIPVLIALGATLTVKPWFTSPARFKALAPTLVFTGAATLSIVLLIALLRIKAGGPLGIQDAISSQKLFYGAGFMMLPLPMPLHPWQVVITVYAAGMITALASWRRHSKSPAYDILFCTSLLGIGLFTYYQGRSHIFCLMMVLWPALIVAAILCDQLLGAVRRRSLAPMFLLLALPFLFLASLGTITLATSGPGLLTAGITNLENATTPRDETVADELEFLRASYRGRDCLILAQRQALYHIELNNASPLPGPGLVETLLKTDLDKLQAAAISPSVKCIYLGVGPDSQTLLKLDDDRLVEHYTVTQKNSLGTLWLLEPKQNLTIGK